MPQPKLVCCGGQPGFLVYASAKIGLLEWSTEVGLYTKDSELIVYAPKPTLCTLTDKSVHSGLIHTAVNIYERRLPIRNMDWVIQYSL